MKNFKFVLVCCLLIYSAVSIAQEETLTDGEEVEIQVENGEEEQPEAPEEEPSEPVPVDPVNTGEFSIFSCLFRLKY